MYIFRNFAYFCIPMADNYLEYRKQEIEERRKKTVRRSHPSLDTLLHRNRSYRGYDPEREVTEQELRLNTEEKLVEGTEGEMGLYITTVDGEQADDKNQEWWKIMQNGEMTQTGADTTKMSDGDTFELVYSVGYY